MSRLNFKLEAQASGSQARAARFQTLHGEVITPVFMPVGTQATVKGQTRETLTTSGAQVLLANTYHLLLRPGPEVFKKLGGIHNFMQWKGPVLTDSGGFQIYSLPNARVMTEEGAKFKSYVDGKTIMLSPEVSIGMQKAIGSDIMMVLDQCVPSTTDFGPTLEAMNRTHRWALRSLQARGDSPQSIFAIVQGACIPELRKQSALHLTQIEFGQKSFDGFAIGGLAVGESKEMRQDFTELTTQYLPRHLPRYLMGVGTPADILEAVHRGVDMFDCILPTAFAQRGVVFTSLGKIQLRRGAFKFADTVLDPNCPCKTCASYSKAYLHHLIKTEEYLGWHLLGVHNLTFYARMMNDIRRHILNDTFATYYAHMKDHLLISDEEFPKTFMKPNHAKRLKASQEYKDAELVLGDYQVQTLESGISSIKHRSSGEVMHSVLKPEQEADALYIKQSKLAERILEKQKKDQRADLRPLVIWDVGMGAATNAMGVVRCCEENASQSIPTREVHLVSFEDNLDSFRLALKNHNLFTYLRHAAPRGIAEEGQWRSKVAPLHWQLIVGNFLETFAQAPAPDLIYFDPFSYKTNPQLWSLDLFQKILQHCGKQTTELFTYSASTAVRAGLLGAGFYVAKGAGTGAKPETTIAFSPIAHPLPHSYLGSEWLERWGRSGSPFPIGLAENEQDEFKRKITQHSQFASIDPEFSLTL